MRHATASRPVRTAADRQPLPEQAVEHGAGRVGALLWLLFPALRGASPWLGNGSLWLLALPASALLAFHREAVAAFFQRR